jgi:tetratricopeptide (TPR) repeat protein
MAGSGKTVASRLYLQQLSWRSVAIELNPRTGYGWPTIQAALDKLGLPSARPLAAIEHIHDPLVIVIDGLDFALDEQSQPHPDTYEWLAALLDNPAIQIVLASARFPHIPDLVSLAASGQVHVIDGHMLAFTPLEAQLLWQQRQSTQLDPERAEQLIARTGGLATMVALACATGTLLEQGDVPFQTLAVARILDALPHTLRALLPALALPESLTPATIEAFTERSDAIDILRELQQRDLLSADRPDRLHPLLRQALLDQLRVDREQFNRLTSRAVALEMASGNYQQAWLFATQAQRWELAREIILHVGAQLRQQGASRTLAAWIEALPAAERSSEIEILLARARADIGDLDGAMIGLETLHAAETDPIKKREFSIWLANVRLARGDVAIADALIVPHLDDPSLELSWRPHVARIHALALLSSGLEEDALSYGQQVITSAQAAGDRRMLAFGYHEHSVIAFRLGRYIEAEQSVRLAARCWRDLDNSPEMAVTLNMRAMIALARHEYDRASEYASTARVHALAGGRLREASIASATCGDVALAQGQHQEALLHYQVAEEDSENSAAYTYLAYSLALQGHVARITADQGVAARVLRRLRDLRERSAASLEELGWITSGIVTSQLALREPPAIDDLLRILDRLGMQEAHVRGFVLLVLSQAYWAIAEPAKAIATWNDLEAMVAHGRGGAQTRLAPLAATAPDLLQAVLSEQSSALARLASSMAFAAPLAPAPEIDSVLTLRMFQNEQVLWHGQPVTLPKHGLSLLIVLLTSAVSVDDEELLRLVWGDEAVVWHTLKKLVMRIRGQMPGLIKRSSGRYTLGIPRAAIDFDLGRFLTLDLQSAPTELLTSFSDVASTSSLHSYDAPWAVGLKSQVNRRLALLWLELARRADADGAQARAGEAFERAHMVDPASDFVTRASMQYALRIGDRTSAMQSFLRYQQALDEQFGVEPARDLQQLYLQALEP